MQDPFSPPSQLPAFLGDVFLHGNAVLGTPALCWVPPLCNPLASRLYLAC